jgi:hypothetical protein
MIIQFKDQSGLSIDDVYTFDNRWIFLNLLYSIGRLFWLENLYLIWHYDIETNFDFGNRCRFNLNCATVILFLRANLHGKELTTTNYLFSQKYSLGEENKGPSINNVGNWEGGRVKIGQNCRRTKKLPTLGRGVSKIWKKCRSRLWMDSYPSRKL